MSQGTSAPHVLVVGPLTEDPGDREWEVLHPDGCPVEHHCGWEWRTWLGTMPYHDTHLACCVQWELDANGIDSLCDEDGREWRTWMWQEGQVGLDQTLTPGRYLIEGWWHSGAGMGEYGGQGDADGGLNLLGPESPAQPEVAPPSGRSATTGDET